MDLRDMAQPFFFILRRVVREPSPDFSPCGVVG
jgi:hypothetical protein